MRKTMLALSLSLVLLLSGCHRLVEEDTVQSSTVYCSFMPIYALALPVFKDIPDMTLRCLVQPQDGCLRSYVLSDWDDAVLSLADALIMGGRGLESFESDVAAMDDAPATLTLMTNLTLIGQDETVPEGDDEASHLTGANPYLYLSVDGAMQMTKSLAGGMMSLDPKYADQYAANLETALSDLEALKSEIEETLLECPAVPVALMHEGLIYFTEEYGLDVGARIDREPATELDASDLDSAVKTMRDAGCLVVLIEKQAPDRLVSDLEKEGFVVARFDTVTSGDDYIGAMRKNARAVADALRLAGGA